MNFSAISNETLLGRMLRLPFRLIPANAQMRILQGHLRGKKWIAGSGNHGYWLGSYEYQKQKIFSEEIRPGDVVYDLGANVGFYSLLASFLVGPKGRVYSFEPLPSNLEFLRNHLALNKVSNCVVYGVAVSDSCGTANFSRGSQPTLGRLEALTGNSITVQTVTLDDLVATGEIPAPSVIKCDIEGGEYAALKGATRTLAAATPALLLASHGQEIHARCCNLLLDLGYVLTPLDGRPLDRTEEVLAVHRDKPKSAGTRARKQ